MPAAKTPEPGSVRREPDGRRVAIKTGPDPMPGSWFVFSPVNGGHYATDDEVADWAEVNG